jgi:HEAT repeats
MIWRHGMNSKPDSSWAIELLTRTLLTDPLPSIRVLAVQTLLEIGPVDKTIQDALNHALANDPDELVRAGIIQAIRSYYAPQPQQPMSDSPKIQMFFNAPVYGAAGNIEGDQIINATDQNFDALLNNYKQFFNDLQQKYPAQTPEAALQPIIDAEFQEIKKTQPQRWQNFLSLKRLWNGGKKATFKVGEHFTEENPWGKAAIAFLEGIMEDSE